MNDQNIEHLNKKTKNPTDNYNEYYKIDKKLLEINILSFESLFFHPFLLIIIVLLVVYKI